MDFSKWAVVGFNDDTGLGRMCQDIQKVLGIGRHLIFPSERMPSKKIQSSREFLMEADLQPKTLRQRLDGLQGLICLERLWNDSLIRTAKKLGLKIVCVPMWEWFRGTDRKWRQVDLFLCPNLKALEVLFSYGFTNAVQVAWPLDIKQLPKRTIVGPAQTFVHNAGLIDNDDRKGTGCVVKAFSKVKGDNLRLILRLQQESPLAIDDPRIDVRIGNLNDPADLYKEGEAFIQPSRMEGLGFMVLEPVSCGLPVISTNAKPMCEYITQPQMLVRKRLFKKKSFAFKAGSIKHAYLTSPSIASLSKVIRWCSLNDLSQISNENLTFGQATHAPQQLLSDWAEALARI